MLQPLAVQCRPRRCRAGVTGGALLGHGHVPGRDGRQGSSPAGLPGPAAWLLGAGDRRQERAAVLQLLGEPTGQPTPTSPRWCEI
ncbi:hypothetical protein H2136_20670 [Aeromonas hydrophila]|uniref:Uncharacterized protein n=1 Tax=Aeromonas hydrophila TaxID=644 RepID=A0A926FPC1_AERHY|nr:hypothetical protein [Aeromonas hydrophila]